MTHDHRPRFAALAAAALLVAGCAGPNAGSRTTAEPAASPVDSSAGAASAASAGAPAGSGVSPSPSVPGSTRQAGSSLPAFSHVYVIVLENRSLSAILGATDMPYLHALITRFGLATAYTGVTHPSEPNYLALFSGSTQGVQDDGVHDLSTRTLADQVEASGRDWRVFAENVPGGCFTGAVASGGADGPGTYARKHEPAISFTAISGSPARCARIQDFGHFDPTAAAFELIIPNVCHDMHDCGTAQGDAFLAGFVPRILGSPRWQQGGVLFLTFDEGSGSDPVATLVIAPDVPAGFRSSVPHDHYSLLRTIEEAWGMPCLAQACHANTLAEFFARPAVTASARP